LHKEHTKHHKLADLPAAEVLAAYAIRTAAETSTHKYTGQRNNSYEHTARHISKFIIEKYRWQENSSPGVPYAACAR
jgi:hypothetical protein